MAAVEIGGQSTESTLMGERHFYSDSMDPCCAVRAAPWSEEDDEVGGDGAARAGGSSSPAVIGGERHHRSPKTASGSRRRRRRGEVADARATTPDGGKGLRRAALFGSEGGVADDGGSHASTQGPHDAAHSLGGAGDVSGAAPTIAGTSGASPVASGDGSGDRVSAPMPTIADAVPNGAGARGEMHQVYAVQRHLDRAEAAGHVVTAKFVSCAAALHALGKDLRGYGRHGDAQQVCAAMFELWGAIDALGTFEGAHAAAKRASAHVPRASPTAEASSEPARPFAPDATRNSADCMPEWLVQAAVLLAADADAAAALSAACDATMAREPVPAPDRLGGRHARRRRYCAAIRLQAGVRATIARRRAASLREVARSVGRPVLMTAGAHSRTVAQQISARAAAAMAAEAESGAARAPEVGSGSHWAAVAEAQRQLAARLQVDPLSMMSQIEYNLAAMRARWAATRAAEAGRTAEASAAETRAAKARAAAEARASAEASAAAAEASAAAEARETVAQEAGLGDHWAAVAEAQRQLAAQLQVDPLSMMSQIEYNLAATRARWAAERAAEAGRTAAVARAMEPPIATDAPT